MRRSDREVRDREAIEAFLSSSKTVRIAFSTDSAPYIVPLSFGYEWRGELPVLYFHSAHEGRKVSLMRADASVGFEIDELMDVQGGSEGCSWTASYFSIIGSGRLEEAEDAEEGTRKLDEGEFLNVCWMPLARAYELVRKGGIRDGNGI